jgi:hypothetical protein
VSFDPHAMLAQRKKKLYPRYQVFVVGKQSPEKTLFLKQMARYGRAEEGFVEPSLEDTMLVREGAEEEEEEEEGKEEEEEETFNSSMYRVWPMIKGSRRCVEFIDISEPLKTDRHWRRRQIVFSYAFFDPSIPNPPSNYEIFCLGGNQTEERKQKLRDEKGRKTLVFDSTAICDEEETLEKSWNAFRRDEPESDIEHISNVIGNMLFPTYGGACSIV